MTPGKSQSVLDLEQRREELRTYKVLRTEELRLEKDAARRQRLQSEVDYLTTELASIEKRLSK